jgi:hypothetical protein
VIQLLIFLIIGIALFSCLMVLALRGKAEGGAATLVEAQQALESLQSDLLDVNITTRLFAKEDVEFVRSQAFPKVEALFLRERKRVAILWVDRVRAQIRLLRRLHLGSARFYARLSVKAELELAMDFALLLVSCRALQLAFVLGGPFAAPGIAGAVTQAAGRVCEVSRQSLAFLVVNPLPTAHESLRL